MARIISIESTSQTCSVALAENDKLIALKETSGNNHSVVLTQFILDVLNEVGLKSTDLDAVAVSKGPGSYTGLRIGVSAAKGLCYSLDIPLIAVDTLYALALSVRDLYPECFICPMIDARRMEVYTALYDLDMNTVLEVHAKIIDESSFQDCLSSNKIVFLGSGAPKTNNVIKSPNAIFDLSHDLSAKNIISTAYQRFTDKKFENIAYFEPFYLKEFVAKKPVVKALRY